MTTITEQIEAGYSALRQSYSYYRGCGLTNAEIAAKYGISLKTLGEMLGYKVQDSKYKKVKKHKLIVKVPKVCFADEAAAEILKDFI